MPHHHGTTGPWDVSLPLTLILVLAAFAYLRGWLHLRSTGARIPVWRAASFLGGLFLIWIAAGSPMVALVHQLLTFHMVQHLLLLTLAPPLIWLGEPLLAFATGLPRAIVNALKFRTPLMQHLGAVLTHPAFGLFAASSALVGWHIPPLFALAMSSGVWHAVQEVTFLGTGLLFWWPVVYPWPSILRPEISTILYLFFATLPCDILSGFLVFCDRVVYDKYLSSSNIFGFSALGDQQCAGALMWTCVTIVYLVAGIVLTMHLLLPGSAGTGKFGEAISRNRTTDPLLRRSVEAL